MEGGCLGPGKEGLGQVGGCLPHVDLLLCRFSTERTVAWNIFRLCTWTRPEGAGNETEPEPGSLPRLRVGPETLEGPEVQESQGEVRASPGSSWRPSAWVLSRYRWRFQLRLGLNMSRAAALASSPTQKVSQEA